MCGWRPGLPAARPAHCSSDGERRRRAPPPPAQVSLGEDGYATVEHLSNLQGHSKAVNCVRVSPTGAQGAGGGAGSRRQGQRG